jgi:hypothetical protein
MTPKQGVRLYKLIDDCHEATKRRGAFARIAVRMPGKWGKQSTRRLCAKGPPGKIGARTYDGKNIIVIFEAARLTTSLEEIRNDSDARRSGN